MNVLKNTTAWNVLKIQQDEFIKDTTIWSVLKTQLDELC
jgi:hypothetical protein